MKHHIFHSPSLLSYTFGENHPYNSGRLEEAMRVLEDWGYGDFLTPLEGTREILEPIHDSDYLSFLEDVSRSDRRPTPEERYRYGIGTPDTPLFFLMYQACLSVAGASHSAAGAVRGGARVAFNLSGGLHHAQRSHASGFCAVSDIAVAIEELKLGFERVAYVDLDLHHGDGVQAIYAGDGRVLCASVHQHGQGFYPGTGFTGEGDLAVNAPLLAGTEAGDWLRVVRDGVLPCVRAFDPGALVLQMGVDAHHYDPLGSLRVTGGAWLDAVRAVGELGLPTVALGGGGYDRRNPPRLWPAAVCALVGDRAPDAMPGWFAELRGQSEVEDRLPPDFAPVPTAAGRADDVMRSLREQERAILALRGI